MAKQAQEEKQPKVSEAPAETSEKKKGSMLVWIIMFFVVAIGAGGGYGLAVLLAGENTPASTTVEQNNELEIIDQSELLATETQSKYDHSMEAVVACLDEPSLSRYVRVSITLQMVPGFDKEKGAAFLESNESVLRDWMTTYLAGLTLVQVQGSRNLEKIKMEIFEEFNQILFKNKKPLIDRILFKEFVVQ